MSKRNKRNRQKRQAPKDELQQMMNRPEVLAAFRMFLTEYQQAQAETHAKGVPLSAMDTSRLAQIIAQHPELATVLDAIRQRHEATQQALQPDLIATGSPSGAYPVAAAQNSSKWATEENDPIAVANTRTLRRWAEENEWVRAAIAIRRKQVERMRPLCVPINPRKKFNKAVRDTIQALLDQPNEMRDSWRSLIGPILEDILVLDRGVLLKNMTLGREPVALYYEDGACIRIYPAWSGKPDEPRYLYVSPDSKVKKPLRNDECICIIDNSATYRFGLSPVQALQRTIEADLAATAAAADMVSMKPPPHALQIPKASPKEIDKVAANYAAKIAGRKQMFFFGGPEIAHLFPLVYSAKDNQWLEWQVYLGRKIAVLFQISPQKLGILNDVNRATAEIQEEIDEDRGLIPLLLLIEEHMNREILADFAPKLTNDRTDINALNLKIIFPEVSDAARKMHAKETISMATQAMPGLPCMTLNMVLAMLGEDPVPGGDTFYVNSAGGAIKWLSYNESLETMPQNQSKPVSPEPTPPNPQEEEAQSENEDEGSGDQGNEENDAQEANNDNRGNDTAQKAWQNFDSRMPGVAWRATSHSPFTTQKSKKIPAKHRPVQPTSSKKEDSFGEENSIASDVL